MHYERVLMDLDDTLFDFQAGNRRAVAALMAELGLASDTVFEEYQAINHACWQALERGEMTQEVLHVERFRRFLRTKGRSDDPAIVAARFAQLLGRQAIPIPGAIESLQRIARHLPVFLLTNGITAIQQARLEISGVGRMVHGAVISQQVGLSKPDPAIFLYALQGIAPGRALMIGDGINSDVLGANRAGIDICWYNPDHKTLPKGLHAEYEIHRIEDCVEIALRDS